MADVKVENETTNITDPDTLTELERMYLVQDPTGTPAPAQVATGVLKKRIRAGKFNTASSPGGDDVPIDLGNKEGLILTLTGNVTTFALPTNGPAGISQETEHPLRVTASGATRTIATGAFAAFDLGGSVAPASGYSLADGTSKDFMLRRIHNGTAAVWFVDLLIPVTDGGTGQSTDVGVRGMIEAAAATNVDLGTSTTLTKASHQGKLLNCTAAINLTVDNSTDFDAWGACEIYAGGGIVTVVATATVRRAGSDPLTIPQYGRAVLMRNATADEYVLSGRLA